MNDRPSDEILLEAVRRLVDIAESIDERLSRIEKVIDNRSMILAQYSAAQDSAPF